MAAPKQPNAPKVAPIQPAPMTGTGQVSPSMATFQPQGGLAPKPVSAGTTGPKIAAPSVDYNTQQGSRIPPAVVAPHDSASGANANQALLNQQSQQVQDKGGG